MRKITLQGCGIGGVVSKDEGQRRLDALTVDDESADWAGSGLLDAEALAEQIGVSTDTILAWHQAGKVLAFASGHGDLYAVRQFQETQPVAGLDQVVSNFPTPEDAWEWLVTPNRSTGGKAPIDLLRQGELDAVVGAAQGGLDFS